MSCLISLEFLFFQIGYVGLAFDSFSKILIFPHLNDWDCKRVVVGLLTSANCKISKTLQTSWALSQARKIIFMGKYFLLHRFFRNLTDLWKFDQTWSGDHFSINYNVRIVSAYPKVGQVLSDDISQDFPLVNHLQGQCDTPT